MITATVGIQEAYMEMNSMNFLDRTGKVSAIVAGVVGVDLAGSSGR